MEVTVVKEKETRKYPYIGIHEDGTIVFFLSKLSGVCLKSDDNDEELYSDAWAEESFEYFKGEISIKQ